MATNSNTHQITKKTLNQPPSYILRTEDVSREQIEKVFGEMNELEQGKVFEYYKTNKGVVSQITSGLQKTHGKDWENMPRSEKMKVVNVALSKPGAIFTLTKNVCGAIYFKIYPSRHIPVKKVSDDDDNDESDSSDSSEDQTIKSHTQTTVSKSTTTTTEQTELQQALSLSIASQLEDEAFQKALVESKMTNEDDDDVEIAKLQSLLQSKLDKKAQSKKVNTPPSLPLITRQQYESRQPRSELIPLNSNEINTQFPPRSTVRVPNGGTFVSGNSYVGCTFINNYNTPEQHFQQTSQYPMIQDPTKPPIVPMGRILEKKTHPY